MDLPSGRAWSDLKSKQVGVNLKRVYPHWGKTSMGLRARVTGSKTFTTGTWPNQPRARVLYCLTFTPSVEPTFLYYCNYGNERTP